MESAKKFLFNHMAAAQRVEVDGKVVSQLCDEERNLTSEQFEEAMRNQVFTTVGRIFMTTVHRTPSNDARSLPSSARNLPTRRAGTSNVWLVILHGGTLGCGLDAAPEALCCNKTAGYKRLASVNRQFRRIGSVIYPCSPLLRGELHGIAFWCKSQRLQLLDFSSLNLRRLSLTLHFPFIISSYSQ